MNKLIVSWFVMYGVNALLTAIWSGGGGLVATTLTQAVSETATTINVSTTDGYPIPGYIYIEDEIIYTTNKTAATFTGLTRGAAQSAVAEHPDNAAVYSLEMGIVNDAIGFKIAQTETTSGSIGATGFDLGFLLRALPQVVLWNYPFLSGGMLIYVRLLFQLIGIGLTVTVVLSGINAFMGVFRR